MVKTISINAGSSNLEWQLYNIPGKEVTVEGLIKHIGLVNGVSTARSNGQTKSEAKGILDHTAAAKILLDDLISMNIITSYDEITDVGHRVVAGSEYLRDLALVADKVIQQAKGLSMLAPPHNPGVVLGIGAFKNPLPDITSVVVSDTAFHVTMLEVIYRYSVVNRHYTDYKIRKYGVHGTSHQYVAQETAKILGKPLKDLKLITCHVGNGVSVTATKGGKPIDTSVDLIPLGGTMTGIRSGSIDPGITTCLLECEPNLDSPQKVRTVLNRDSGLLGISEKSSDMRDILVGKEEGDERCRLAYDIYIDRLQKHIARYLVVLNGADAIAFTAGIGENSSVVREDIISSMTWLDADTDPARNVSGAYGVISTDQAHIKTTVTPTDEESITARDAKRFKNSTN